MFLHPAKCLGYSLTGLDLWFHNMIPALFPFMVLSGIMLRMNLADKFAAIVKPLFYPLFRINNSGIFAIVSGFLFGFPMGARIITDLYSNKKLTKTEASYLLAFCNNIGPIYFISFVLSTLNLKRIIPYLIGMYGIPFVYGIILRHTVYRNIIQGKPHEMLSPNVESEVPMGFLEALDVSITSGLHGITRLGGYMIFFNLLNILPNILLPYSGYSAIINAVFEITSGISAIGSSNPLAVFILLPAGGLSCIAQTYSAMEETDLSLSHYVGHKLVLTLITICYYVVYQSIFSFV